MLDITHKSLIDKGFEITTSDILEDIKNFPTTRYYGSKKRLLPWIYENTKELKFNTVLDAFGGTASASLLFQSMGKQVN